MILTDAFQFIALTIVGGEHRSGRAAPVVFHQPEIIKDAPLNDLNALFY